MELLSRTQENRIIDAAERVVDMVNQGAAPNDAMFKVASEEKLTPEFVRRLTEVFNTSRLLAHFNVAPPEKRADAFPLVDASVVLSRMYPKLEKAACDGKIRRTSGFAAPPDFTRPALTKAAEAPSDHVFGQEKTYGPASLAHVVRRANLLKDAAERTVDQLRTDEAYQRHQLQSHLMKAADCFWKIDRPAFADVEAQALAQYGPQAQPVMAIVYQLCGGELMGEKRAESPANAAIFDENEPPYCHVRNALRTVSDIVALAHKRAAAEAELTEYAQALSVSLRGSPANGETRRIPFPFDDLLDKRGAAVPSMTTAILLGNQLSQIFDEKGTPPDVMEHKIQHGFDPEFESSLRAARTKALLNEFMTSDPVISRYPNEDVVGAYNEISSMVPRVASQPAMLRGLLARRLELGRIDPFEAAQIVTTERSLRQTEQ